MADEAVLQMVHRCWNEDPNERPDFVTLQSIIRRINKYVVGCVCVWGEVGRLGKNTFIRTKKTLNICTIFARKENIGILYNY